MSRKRKAKAPAERLAKVIAFQGWRSERAHGDAAVEAEDAAHRNWNEARKLRRQTDHTSPREKIEALQTVVRRALQSQLAIRTFFENQLGGRFPISFENAKWWHYSGDRLGRLTEWDDWCNAQLEQSAEPARVYSLAEFRAQREARL